MRVAAYRGVPLATCLLAVLSAAEPPGTRYRNLNEPPARGESGQVIAVVDYLTDRAEALEVAGYEFSLPGGRAAKLEGERGVYLNDGGWANLVASYGGEVAALRARLASLGGVPPEPAKHEVRRLRVAEGMVRLVLGGGKPSMDVTHVPAGYYLVRAEWERLVAGYEVELAGLRRSVAALEAAKAK